MIDDHKILSVQKSTFVGPTPTFLTVQEMDTIVPVIHQNTPLSLFTMHFSLLVPSPPSKKGKRNDSGHSYLP